MADMPVISELPSRAIEDRPQGAMGEPTTRIPFGNQGGIMDLRDLAPNRCDLATGRNVAKQLNRDQARLKADPGIKVTGDADVEGAMTKASGLKTRFIQRVESSSDSEEAKKALVRTILDY